MRRFVCPVFAEASPVELRVRSGGGAKNDVVSVPREHVAFVTGNVSDLVSLERTAERVLVDMGVGATANASSGVTDPAPIVVEPDFDAFTKRVLAAPHRAVLDAIVVAYCAWGLDIVLPVAGRFWSAAKGGAPLSDADVKHLAGLVFEERMLVDPDRTASYGEFRSLHAIDAALVGDGPRLVHQAVEASFSEAPRKRWISVIASALELLGTNEVVDAVAIDVLACALRPVFLEAA